MYNHLVINKGFLSDAAAAAHPRYQQRFVAVGELRVQACIRVFIGITIVTSRGKAANCKVTLLQD